MVVRSYTAAERKRYKEAARRYGPATAQRTLRALLPGDMAIPDDETMYRWMRDEGIVPSEDDVAFWDEHERLRKHHIQEALATRIPAMMSMMDGIIERGDAKSLSPMMVGMGIAIDKIVPSLARGAQHGGISIEGAAGAHITLNVISPPRAVAPPLPMDAIEGEFTETVG